MKIYFSVAVILDSFFVATVLSYQTQYGTNNYVDYQVGNGK